MSRIMIDRVTAKERSMLLVDGVDYVVIEDLGMSDDKFMQMIEKIERKFNKLKYKLKYKINAEIEHFKKYQKIRKGIK